MSREEYLRALSRELRRLPKGMLLKTEYGEAVVNGENKGSNITLEREQAKNRLELTSENGNITISTR